MGEALAHGPPISGRSSSSTGTWSPWSTRVTPSASTISASACGEAGDQVRAGATDGRDPDSPGAELDLGPDQLLLAAHRAQRGRARSPVTSRRPAAARPISLCRAGTTNISKETYAETGLPGSVKIGVAVLADDPEPLRLAGLHRHLEEVDGAELAEHLLDHVVGALADTAARHHEVGPRQLVAERLGERGGVVGARPTR